MLDKLMDTVSEALLQPLSVLSFLFIMMGVSMVKKFDSFIYGISKKVQSIGKKQTYDYQDKKEGVDKWKSSAKK